MDYELIEDDPHDKYDPAPFLSYARARSADKAERDADVADVVHYWDGRGCRAGLVADIDDSVLIEDPTYTLMVIENYEWHPKGCVSHDEDKAPGSWHWPCGGH